MTRPTLEQPLPPWTMGPTEDPGAPRYLVALVEAALRAGWSVGVERTYGLAGPGQAFMATVWAARGPWRVEAHWRRPRAGLRARGRWVHQWTILVGLAAGQDPADLAVRFPRDRSGPAVRLAGPSHAPWLVSQTEDVIAANAAR